MTTASMWSRRVLVLFRVYKIKSQFFVKSFNSVMPPSNNKMSVLFSKFFIHLITESCNMRTSHTFKLPMIQSRRIIKLILNLSLNCQFKYSRLALLSGSTDSASLMPSWKMNLLSLKTKNLLLLDKNNSLVQGSKSWRKDWSKISIQTNSFFNNNNPLEDSNMHKESVQGTGESVMPHPPGTDTDRTDMVNCEEK